MPNLIKRAVVIQDLIDISTYISSDNLDAGDIEGIKLICPPAGIPIEVGKRLYDIY